MIAIIPVKDSLIDIDTLPGREIAFGIGDPRWVMKTQADLYSDITTAIIREYSTNAYDANVMAGNPDPIRVTLPSLMDPYFVVEDDGVGMDIGTFERVYTQFGVSDKRESNDTNGMLGYGSKSGVAYTTQFEVTSVKDGIKIHGIVKRKPDWAIVLKVVSTAKTNEPNGTRIRIPVHNVDEFIHKANEFYKFWLPGRVLVNGKEPVQDVGEKITEGLYYSTSWDQSYIVMGNVAYRIANPAALFRDTKMNRINFVAYVDTVGDGEDEQAAVEFTPSREDLKYTDHTKATLQKVIHNFENEIISKAKSEIDSAADHAEAFLAWSKWCNRLGRSMFDDLEFKGDKFESRFFVNGRRYNVNSSHGAVIKIRDWNVEAMPKTMVVTDFNLMNISTDVRRKAKQFASMKGWDASYIIFIETDGSEISSPWFKKDKFVSWEDLKASLPKTPPKPRAVVNTGGRIPGSFDYITKNGWEYEKELPKNLSDVFYITVSNSKRFVVRNILIRLGVDATVIVLPRNRLNKFNRENPTVREFVSYARSKVIEDGESLLSQDAKTSLDVEFTSYRWLTALDVSKVDDPELIRLEGLIRNRSTLTKAYEGNLELASSLGVRNTVTQYSSNKNISITDRYRLLSLLSPYNFNEDIYIYLNAAYAAEQENKNG